MQYKRDKVGLVLSCRCPETAGRPKTESAHVRSHNFDIENRKRCGWPVDLKNRLFQKLVDIRDAGESDFTAGERPAL